MKLFSYKDRPVHLGPYPLERLRRQQEMPDLGVVPPMRPVSYVNDANPESLINAMTRYIGMLYVVRDGVLITPVNSMRILPGTTRGVLEELVARTGANELMVTSVAYDLSARLRSIELLADHWVEPSPSTTS